MVKTLEPQLNKNFTQSQKLCIVLIKETTILWIKSILLDWELIAV